MSAIQDISIIIPTKNGGEYIKETLARIFNQDTANKILEIIVIDSGSQDETLDIVSSFPNIKLFKIEPKEFGHGRTRNFGVKQARGEFLVFANQDAWPVDSYWLKNLIEPLESDSTIAGAYSRHLPRRGCHLYVEREVVEGFSGIRRIKSRDDLISAINDKKDFKKNRVNEITRFSTVSCAIKKEIFEKIPFDNDIPVAEDQEWAKRILLANYKIVYEPSSGVWHSHNTQLSRFLAFSDASVKVYDQILERKINYLLFFLPSFFLSTAQDICFDVVYIIQKTKNPIVLFKELYLAVLSRIVINLGRSLAMLVSSGDNQ